MVLKRFTGGLGSLLNKRPSQDEEISPNLDTPEANAARGVRLFCESGAANSGEEVLHLPTIVESAVASPSAASAACGQIRKFLSKDNYTRPHVQYNAIMLIRILADNPGQSFTKNMDKGFADTLKQLLRNGRDPSVNQILRDTLDALSRDKAYDTNLNVVFAMWRKEKGLMASATSQQPGHSRTLTAPPWNSNAPPPGVGGGESYGRSSKPERGLPPPLELSGRIEEARTSAKLLLQLVQSTPPTELLSNELVKEFSERCVSAQRSIQGYINCDNPPPDDDTMLTLIETNEQLSLAASKHHRAVLQARRTLGPTPLPPLSTANSNNPLPAIPASSGILTNPPPSPPPLPQPPRADPTFILPSNIHTDDLSRTPSYPTIAPTIPLSLQAAPHHQRTASPTTTHFADDPFADHYSGGYDAPSSPPPPPPPRAAVQRLSEREEALQRDRERDRNGDPGLGLSLSGYKTTTTTTAATTHSPISYHLGSAAMFSYLQRQEGADRNVTTHGAASPPRPALDDDDLDRDYAMANGGRPGGRLGDGDEASEPRTPERVRVRPDSEVSPIAERGAVTYRY